MKSSLPFTLVGCFCFLFPSAGAQAEIVEEESIEWVSATSDRVVIGKVLKVDAITDQDRTECQAVTIAITKTLKGTHTDRETFVLRPYIFKGFAKHWMDEGIPIVFCLIKNDGKRVSFPARQFAWILRDNDNGPSAVLLGKSKHHFTGCIDVLTRRFDVLTEPDAILKYFENTVKPKVVVASLRSHTVSVPGRSAVYKKLWSGSDVRLILPVDQELEELGRTWCGTDPPDQREEGAKILGCFKNQRNTEVLTPLLRDPSTAEETMGRTVPGKSELKLVSRKKVYYVRRAAFDALLQLGAKVEKPVLEELLEGRDDSAGRKR